MWEVIEWLYAIYQRYNNKKVTKGMKKLFIDSEFATFCEKLPVLIEHYVKDYSVEKAEQLVKE